MKVTLITHTPEPEKIIAAAAKLCYASADIDTLLEGLNEENTTNFIDMLTNIGHESPIEHVSFTFGIEGVSRALLAQITRHRIASFSVQSQRYVEEKDFRFVTPPEISDNPEAIKIFNEQMDSAINAYNKLADILKDKHYETFISQGFDEKTAKQKAQKKAIEDARFVLPNACETKMIVTMNARSLFNFFKLRCCQRAQWEIKAVADEMLRLCCEVAPVLFKNAGPSCVRGNCTEGKMSCGKPDEIRAFYKELKNGTN
jgi:thymidylate synthase (FAD)